VSHTLLLPEVVVEPVVLEEVVGRAVTEKVLCKSIPQQITQLLLVAAGRLGLVLVGKGTIRFFQRLHQQAVVTGIMLLGPVAMVDRAVEQDIQAQKA
jgi:hypothetical protein